MQADNVLPDLQASILCEDVRQELNGLQTLVGVINLLPTPALPVGLLKLCLWTRWCGGFRQISPNLSDSRSRGSANHSGIAH